MSASLDRLHTLFLDRHDGPFYYLGHHSCTRTTTTSTKLDEIKHKLREGGFLRDEEVATTSSTDHIPKDGPSTFLSRKRQSTTEHRPQNLQTANHSDLPSEDTQLRDTRQDDTAQSSSTNYPSAHTNRHTSPASIAESSSADIYSASTPIDIPPSPLLTRGIHSDDVHENNTVESSLNHIPSAHTHRYMSPPLSSTRDIELDDFHRDNIAEVPSIEITSARTPRRILPAISLVRNRNSDITAWRRPESPIPQDSSSVDPRPSLGEILAWYFQSGVGFLTLLASLITGLLLHFYWRTNLSTAFGAATFVLVAGTLLAGTFKICLGERPRSQNHRSHIP